MWQNILIALIILGCALYLGRFFYRQARGKSGCGCTCTGCPSTEAGEQTKGCRPDSPCGPENRK